MDAPKWKKFEQLAAKVQRSLAPAATVTLNDKIIGRITGVPRQIDISIRQKIGQYEMVIAIDCKDLAVPADVKDVEEVIGLVQDIGAHRGVIVSASGFTSTALTRGRQAGLDLYRLIDCGDHDWKANVAIPVLNDFRRIRSYAFRFSGKGFPVAGLSDLQNVLIYDEDQKPIGVLADLLKKKWNDNELVSEPGHYEDIDFIGKPVKIEYREIFFDVTISAILDIEKNLYFGYLPLIEFSGFSDEIHGFVTTTELRTDIMDVTEVERSWQKIASKEDLAVQPVFSFTARDRYSLNVDLEENEKSSKVNAV